MVGRGRRIYSNEYWSGASKRLAPDLPDLRAVPWKSPIGFQIGWRGVLVWWIPEYEGLVMVVIRLSRGGAKKRPFFNIVVADSRTRRDGRFIERVGFYNPVASGGEQPLRVAFDRVDFWAGNGAQLSPTVARLVAQAKATA